MSAAALVVNEPGTNADVLLRFLNFLPLIFDTWTFSLNVLRASISFCFREETPCLPSVIVLIPFPSKSSI